MLLNTKVGLQCRKDRSAHTKKRDGIESYIVAGQKCREKEVNVTGSRGASPIILICRGYENGENGR